MRTSFLTGSHVYGTPGPESDIDLVVRVSSQEAEKLQEQADKVCGRQYKNLDENLVILRFGKLNLICCITNNQLSAWREATEAALDESTLRGHPLKKKEVVPIFQRIFKKAGLR